MLKNSTNRFIESYNDYFCNHTHVYVIQRSTKNRLMNEKKNEH